MKYALLIAGAYREFELAIKSWSFLKEEEFDIYISTWSTSVVYHPQYGNLSKGPVTETRIRNTISPVGITILEDMPGINNSIKMMNQWNSVISLMKNSGRHYDAVILIRPDIFLEIKDNTFIDTIRTLDSDTLYTIGANVVDGKLLGMQDQLFAGTPEIISRLSLLPIYEYTEGRDIHFWLVDHIPTLFSKFDDLSKFCRYCIVRANATPADIHSFDRVREKTKVWWETLTGGRYEG